MAERRMFTKKVTDDDNFMSLSSSAQALYLHLSMSADDDGFCNQVNVCMFKAHASIQDLKALLEKRYIYQFENGVIVIKHWRMANALRKDRYTQTAFKEELAMLEIKDNGSYTMKNGVQSGCRLVATCLPQDRLGKDSIDKDINTIVHQDERVTSKTDSFEQEFEVIWKRYPRKQGKTNALKAYIKARKNGCTAEMISNGLDAYLAYIKIERVNPQYIKMGSTWFNQACWTDDYTTSRKPTTKDIAPAMDFEDF